MALDPGCSRRTISASLSSPLFSTTSFFFVIGGTAASLIRLEIFSRRGRSCDLGHVQPSLLHARHHHGVVLPDPVDPNTLGNFIVPLMIGARDLAFPRLNLLSWYLFMSAAALTLFAILAGGVDTGWTFYTPFSTLYSNSHVVAAAVPAYSSPASPRS